MRALASRLWCSDYEKKVEIEVYRWYFGNIIALDWGQKAMEEKKMKTNYYQIKTASLAVVVSGYFMFLTGCASPYQPCGFGGGYSEIQLDENVFQVSFRGNGYTSRERASDLCLLRAAEIAKQHDIFYFIIVEKDNHVDQSAYTTPTTTTTTANINTYGNANVYRNNINYNSNSFGTATS